MLPPSNQLHQPPHDHNAAWLGIEWVNEPASEPAIQALATDLLQYRISTVYVYTTYMRSDDTFGPSYAHAPAFVRQLKKAYPEVVIQAWIGLPLKLLIPGLWAGTVDLADPDVRTRIIDLAVQLVEEAGFDGVHLDPEPVTSGNGNLIRLLAETRQRLPDGAILSIAGRRIAPLPGRIPELVASPVAWSARYYREVASHVDEIAVMVYDSTLPWAWAYRAWTCAETIRLSRALADAGIRLYIGIPTSEEETYTHHPEAENISSGIDGVLCALKLCRSCAAMVTGLAVYPYWETDAQEWGTFEMMWLLE